MRIVCLIILLSCFSGCSPEKKTRNNIEALQEQAGDTRYEIGVACMQYILRHGDNISYSKGLVKKLMDLGFFSEAAFAIGSLLDKYPGDPELYHMRSICYRGQHQYDFAIRDGMRATHAEPQNAVFVAGLRATEAEQKLWNEIELLNETLLHSADSFDILLQRAGKFFAIKEYDAVLYDLGSISKMRSPADSAYYANQVATLHKESKRPVEILSRMLAYFQVLKE
jgi:tetratricopeptide (TPR) repeat protein